MAWEEYNELPKVAVCYPYISNVAMEWVTRTWGPLNYGTTLSFKKKSFYCRNYPIDVAREWLVEQALKEDSDYILFIDTDIMPQSNPLMIVKDMIERNIPILSGLYKAKKYGSSPWAMWRFIGENKGFIPIKKWKDRFVEVDVTGLGWTLIKREVFDDTPKPWFKWESWDQPSEDFYFLLKAKANGFRTIVDTDIKLEHIGEYSIHPDEEFTASVLKI